MAKGGKKGGRKQFTSAETLERENRGKADDSDDDDDDEDDRAKKGGRSGNKMAQQSSNVGELPPNSSDEEEEAPRKPKGKEKVVQPGDLPPSDSDESGSDDDSSSDDGPAAPPPRQLTRKEREQLEAQRAAPDPEQVAADLEKLRLVREKRAAQAAARIAAEGYDRYAPAPGAPKEEYPLAALASKPQASADAAVAK